MHRRIFAEQASENSTPQAAWRPVMKAAYLGGTRGYQSAYYRPGSGWVGGDGRRRFRPNRPVMLAGAGARISPLTVSRQKRPGLVAKAIILAFILVASLAMCVALGVLTLF
jgi:hypothetical protein